jgi:uncharacterized phage protein (TIGR01671 family)
MSREIIFRGKIIDNSGWAYGSLVVEVDKNYIALNINDNIKRDDYDVYMVEVIPRTVGQYAGLYDKNGKAIWEGDIVEYENMTGKIMFFNGSFILSDLEETEEWELGVINAEIEVIGNIYENRELLGGE